MESCSPRSRRPPGPTARRPPLRRNFPPHAGRRLTHHHGDYGLGAHRSCPALPICSHTAAPRRRRQNPSIVMSTRRHHRRTFIGTAWTRWPNFVTSVLGGVHRRSGLLTAQLARPDWPRGAVSHGSVPTHSDKQESAGRRHLGGSWRGGRKTEPIRSGVIALYSVAGACVAGRAAS